MVVDLDAAFEDFGGLPTNKDAVIEHLNRIPISVSLKRRYLRAWSDRTKVDVFPGDYQKLSAQPLQR
jgi:hypothetical protein